MQITALLDPENVVNLGARAQELRSANRKCDPKVPAYTIVRLFNFKHSGLMHPWRQLKVKR